MKKFFLMLAICIFSIKIFALSLSAPTLVSPADSAKNQMPNVFLDWTSVTGAITYKIQVDSSSLFTNPEEYITTLSAINASELLFGIRYYWRVKAVGLNDSSNWSSPVRCFTILNSFQQLSPKDSTLLCPPDTLFRWTNITGITFYDIQIDTSLNFNSSLLYINSIDTNRIQPSNLFFGMKYYWRVRCRHSKDTSAWSEDTLAFGNNWCFFVRDRITLYYPADSTVNVAPDVQMKWKKLTGIIKYEYQTDTSDLFNSSKLFTGYVSFQNNIYFVNADTLDFNTFYYWRVRAIHLKDTSEWSVVHHFTIMDTVKILSPLNGNIVYTNTPKVKWSTITGLSGYKLEVDTTQNFVNPIKYSPDSAATQQQLTGLSLGKTYYWRIRAISIHDTSSWNTKMFKISAAGITSATYNSSISIYPNPAYGNTYLRIESNNASKVYVTIMDILGKKVLEESFDNIPGVNLKKLNLGGLVNGIYLLKLTDGNNTHVQKITISK